MSTRSNQPAFPGVQGVAGYGGCDTPATGPNGETVWVTHNQGMSLREHYAGMAMQALAGCSLWDCTPQSCAVRAVEYADALIAALEAKP